MCLHVSEAHTKSAKEKLPDFFYVYKVCAKMGDGLYSGLRRYEIKMGEYFKPLSLDRNSTKIEGGAIHVLKTEELAKKYKEALIYVKDDYHLNYVIVRCFVRKEDLIAVGRTGLYEFGDTVFETHFGGMCFEQIFPVEIV